MWREALKFGWRDGRHREQLGMVYDSRVAQTIYAFGYTVGSFFPPR